MTDEIACEKALERAIVHSHQGRPEENSLWTRLNDATIPGYRMPATSNDNNCTKLLWRCRIHSPVFQKPLLPDTG